MTASKFQMFATATPESPVDRPKPIASIAALASLLVLTLLASWIMHNQATALLGKMDDETLRQSNQMLSRFVEQQRTHLLSEVSVLAEDTRIRSTVLTPELDEATITDVLADLQKSSSASVLAVLDVSGKVRSVVGANEMRNLDLGSSALVRAAMEKPSTYVWTFTDKVRVLGVAPIRTGGQVAALFMMGFELGESTLGAIESALGGHGAVVIGDKVVSTTSKDQVVLDAFTSAMELDEGTHRLVRSGRDYLASASPVSSAVSAGRTIWMIPRHQHVERVGLLRIVTWAPAVFMSISFAIALALALRKGSQTLA